MFLFLVGFYWWFFLWFFLWDFRGGFSWSVFNWWVFLVGFLGEIFLVDVMRCVHAPGIRSLAEGMFVTFKCTITSVYIGILS